LQGVLEIWEVELACIKKALGRRLRDAHKAREVQKKVLGFPLPAFRRDKIVEVGEGVPGGEGSARMLFQEVEEVACRLGERLPIERQVDQDIRVQEDDHR
jgi:hypothetical protein